MASYTKILPSDSEIDQWDDIKPINPRNGSILSTKSKNYKILEKYSKRKKKRISKELRLELESLKVQKKEKSKNEYEKIEPSIEYDYDTIETYKAMRIQKMCVLSYDILTKQDMTFSFDHVWDPYTGERKYKDPYGPLCINPDCLIRHFWMHLLDHLWIRPVDEAGGYYHGYYGEGVGLGKYFNIIGRGAHPEWYLFRLPIPDCYLAKDHNSCLISFGPNLTKDEVNDIYKKSKSGGMSYKKEFGSNRPNLELMWDLYHKAIDDDPPVPGKDELSEDDIVAYKNKYNRDAIDELCKLKGLYDG